MNKAALTAPISDIQRFSTGDGGGIRSTVFFKGCTLRCAWCHNPETISAELQTLVYPSRTAVSGGRKSVAEVLSVLLEDEEFYRESGGGVTLSGGEPMLYPDFCAALCVKLKEKNIHVIIDTAGCVDYENFAKVLPFADEFYYDLKCADGTDYLRFTGGSFDLVRDNLYGLVSGGADVTVGVPLIPGVNASPEYCERLAEIIALCGVKKVRLLPFHRLGAPKYAALGMEYSFADVKPLPPECVAFLSQVFTSRGLSVKIEN